MRPLDIGEAYFKDGYNTGKAEGRAEGKAEGKAEGEAETRAEIAKAMLSKGMSIETISELTGLSFDVIQTLCISK